VQAKGELSLGHPDFSQIANEQGGETDDPFPIIGSIDFDATVPFITATATVAIKKTAPMMAKRPFALLAAPSRSGASSAFVTTMD
jgi:hypothetical protein